MADDSKLPGSTAVCPKCGGQGPTVKYIDGKIVCKRCDAIKKVS